MMMHLRKLLNDCGHGRHQLCQNMREGMNLSEHCQNKPTRTRCEDGRVGKLRLACSTRCCRCYSRWPAYRRA
jgi:hypothetical protein